MKSISFVIILIGLTVFGIKSNVSSKINNLKLIVIDSTQKKVIDPACKMNIKPEGAKTTIYNKITYYFCSESCKQKFTAAPSKYIKK